MPLIAVGISHRTAPIDIRERLAFSGQDQAEALAELISLDGVEEAVLVSTCNRTEVYAIVSPDHADQVRTWLAACARLDEAQSGRHFYSHRNEDAVAHLFRVASGLESLVLGEPQILGQLKQAWQAAIDCQAIGKVTDRLFQRAFAAGKAVRHETGIASHPVSVAYITTILARQIFGQLASRTVLLIGAGEMIQLCGQHFHSQGVEQLIIANRSPQRALELAAQFEAESAGLDRLGELLPRADILVSSTASREPLIGADDIRAAMKARRSRPMFLVDIAVPRDIDPLAAGIEGAYLYTIDDLQQVADKNRDERHRAAEGAASTIDDAVIEFMRWLHGARAADSLRRLRGYAEAAGAELVKKAERQIAAGQDPAEVLAKFAGTLTHQILHGPTKRLREAAEEEKYNMLKAADWLFDSGLDPVPDDREEDA